MLTDLDVRYCISLLFTQLIMNSFCYSFIQFTDFSVELNEFQCFWPSSAMLMIIQVVYHPKLPIYFNVVSPFQLILKFEHANHPGKPDLRRIHWKMKFYVDFMFVDLVKLVINIEVVLRFYSKIIFVISVILRYVNVKDN